MGSTQSSRKTSNAEELVDNSNDTTTLSTPVKSLTDDFDPRSPSLRRTPVAPGNFSSPKGKGKNFRGIKSNIDPRSPGLKRTPFKPTTTTPSKLVSESLVDPRSPSSRTPIHKGVNAKRFESPYPTRREEVGTPYAQGSQLEVVAQKAIIEPNALVVDAHASNDVAVIVEANSITNNLRSLPDVDGASQTFPEVKREVSRKRKPTMSRDVSTAMSPLKKSFSSSDTENAHPVTPTHSKLSSNVATRSPLSTLSHKNSFNALPTIQG